MKTYGEPELGRKVEWGSKESETDTQRRTTDSLMVCKSAIDVPQTGSDSGRRH